VIERGKKLVRMALGVVLVVLGLALSVPGIPGPGIAVLLLGLSVLSTDSVWARRFLERVKAMGRQVLERRRRRGVAL
jgi:hypothetical protein